MKKYDASDLFHSAGIGMGGKVGKHGYITLSLDYFTTRFNKIDWEVSINKDNPEDVGSRGTLTHSMTGENIKPATTAYFSSLCSARASDKPEAHLKYYRKDNDPVNCPDQGFINPMIRKDDRSLFVVPEALKKH
jgi:hypothetical protein